MFIHLNKRAQSTLEYAVVIAIIAAALIAMQVYIKRGVQGRMKQASDDIGSQFSPGQSTSYTSSTSNVTSFENVYQDTTANMAATYTSSNQTQGQTVNATVGILNLEKW